MTWVRGWRRTRDNKAPARVSFVSVTHAAQQCTHTHTYTFKTARQVRQTKKPCRRQGHRFPSWTLQRTPSLCYLSASVLMNRKVSGSVTGSMKQIIPITGDCMELDDLSNHDIHGASLGKLMYFIYFRVLFF